MEVELDNLENETIQELEENASREALGLPVADSSGTGNGRFLPSYPNHNVGQFHRRIGEASPNCCVTVTSKRRGWQRR